MNPVSGPAKERPASDRGSWGDAAATWQRLPAKSLSWVSIQGACNYRVCAFTGKRARGDSAPRQGAERSVAAAWANMHINRYAIPDVMAGAGAIVLAVILVRHLESV